MVEWNTLYDKFYSGATVSNEFDVPFLLKHLRDVILHPGNATTPPVIRGQSFLYTFNPCRGWQSKVSLFFPVVSFDPRSDAVMVVTVQYRRMRR